MFKYCSKLSIIPNIEKWDTSKLKKIKCMFYGCSSLSKLPNITKWDAFNSGNIRSLCDNCISLSGSYFGYNCINLLK